MPWPSPPPCSRCSTRCSSTTSGTSSCCERSWRRGDLHAATEAADPFVAEYLMRLAVEDSDADPVDVRRLLLRDAGQRCSWSSSARAMDAADKAAYATAIGWLTEMEAAGADAPPDQHREDELLRWLSHRAEES
ncbi:MAG: hypothetical protein R2746_00775 [Acidimicrobiales bacterium]